MVVRNNEITQWFPIFSWGNVYPFLSKYPQTSCALQPKPYRAFKILIGLCSTFPFRNSGITDFSFYIPALFIHSFYPRIYTYTLSFCHCLWDLLENWEKKILIHGFLEKNSNNFENACSFFQNLVIIPNFHHSSIL